MLLCWLAVDLTADEQPASAVVRVKIRMAGPVRVIAGNGGDGHDFYGHLAPPSVTEGDVVDTDSRVDVRPGSRLDPEGERSVALAVERSRDPRTVSDRVPVGCDHAETSIGE